MVDESQVYVKIMSIFSNITYQLLHLLSMFCTITISLVFKQLTPNDQYNSCYTKNLCWFIFIKNSISINFITFDLS